jgi:hypothetical protein
MLVIKFHPSIRRIDVVNIARWLFKKLPCVQSVGWVDQADVRSVVKLYDEGGEK